MHLAFSHFRADTDGAKKVDNSAFVEAAKSIPRPRRHVELFEGRLFFPMEWPLEEVRHEVGGGELWEALGDGLCVAATRISWEPSLLAISGRVLNEAVQDLSILEEFISPVVAIVDKDE